MITLVIAVSIVGFIRHQVKLSNALKGDISIYDVGKITNVISIIEIYFFGNPAVLYLAGKFLLNIQKLR